MTSADSHDVIVVSANPGSIFARSTENAGLWAAALSGSLLRRRVLAEDPTNELVLSPSVLLELLSGPQREAVAEEHSELRAAMHVAPIDDVTIAIAARAMETLAMWDDHAHRLPVADLLTAATAHQHGYGVIHVDAHFERLARHAGLSFETRFLQARRPA